jgi:hypothetical protein
VDSSGNSVISWDDPFTDVTLLGVNTTVRAVFG